MSYLGSLKIFNHSKVYLKWYRKGRTTHPITVKIDLTNKCNHSCSHCIDRGFRGDEFIDKKKCMKLINELRSLGVLGVHFTGGGEPLLHENAYEILMYAKKSRLEVGLITNGSLLKSKYADCCDWIRVSLDAENEKEYKNIHGPNANWERTFDGIKSIIGRTYVTIHSLNCENPVNFINLSKKLGANAAQISPLINKPVSVSTQKIKTWKKAEDDSFSVIVNEEKFNIQERNYTTCEGQHFKATNICADGSVYICCHLAGKDFAKIGNIYTSTFKEIWRSDLRKRVIKKLDILKCPKLCVCDSLNRTLYKIKKYNHRDSL